VKLQERDAVSNRITGPGPADAAIPTDRCTPVRIAEASRSPLVFNDILDLQAIRPAEMHAALRPNQGSINFEVISSRTSILDVSRCEIHESMQSTLDQLLKTSSNVLQSLQGKAYARMAVTVREIELVMAELQESHDNHRLIYPRVIRIVVRLTEDGLL
jgi:hypothetical protein